MPKKDAINLPNLGISKMIALQHIASAFLAYRKGSAFAQELWLAIICFRTIWPGPKNAS
jgi:hypothetical protein